MFLVAVLAAAALGCAATAGVVWWWVGRRVRQLRAELEEEIERLTAEAVARMGDEVETRVRQGVRDGIRDGVTNLPSRAVLEETTRTAAKAGVDWIGEGLDALLGGRRDPR